MLVKDSKGDIPVNWDDELKDNGDWLQTSYWANVIRDLDKAVPIFLDVYNHSEKVSKLLLFHCFPWDRRHNELRKDLVGNIFRKGFIRFYGAPCHLTKDQTLAAEATIEIFRWIENYTKNNKILYIDIVGVYNHTFPEIDILTTYENRKWATYEVNLNVDEVQLWSNLSGAARKAINKARREDIIIDKISNFDDFLELYLKNYNLFKGEETVEAEINNYRIIWDRDVNKNYSYHLAKIDDLVIGMLGMYIFNGVATEIMSALSPEAFERKLPAQDILHWEMFLEAKKMGCHSFDLAGINPDPKSPKELGIKRFKEKWNGRYIEYYNYSKITQPILRVIYRAYKKIKNVRG